MSFQDNTIRDKLKYNILDGAQGSARFRTYREGDPKPFEKMTNLNDSDRTGISTFIMTNINTILLVIILIVLFRMR